MTKNVSGADEKETTIVTVKKRGRKSKKEIEEAQKLVENSNKINCFTLKTEENIIVNIEEHDDLSNLNTNCVNEITNSDDENEQISKKPKFGGKIKTSKISKKYKNKLTRRKLEYKNKNTHKKAKNLKHRYSRRNK
jgi:hypothetical protein